MSPEEAEILLEAKAEIEALGVMVRKYALRFHRGLEYPLYAELIKAGWTPPGGFDDTLPTAEQVRGTLK